MPYIHFRANIGSINQNMQLIIDFVINNKFMINFIILILKHDFFNMFKILYQLLN